MLDDTAALLCEMDEAEVPRWERPFTPVKAVAHYALPAHWHRHTVLIVTWTTATILTILVSGVVFMDVLHLVEPARIWNGWRRHQ